jgi:two-component system response regulator YesN
MPSRVVIADDDLDYRDFVRSLIASASDTMTIVGEAADGEAALTVVLRERPDIVITDLVMPHLDGIELTRRIRHELPQTIIVLMSSYTEDAYRLLASDSGADAFVSKQVLPSSLLSAIRDLIARRLSGGSDPTPPTTGASSSFTAPSK